MAATLDALFAALSDPTRRSLLARLAAGEATVLELAEPFDLSQPAITKHLKVLEAAGLVRRSREGARRPARLEVEALEAAAAWIRELARTFRTLESPGRSRPATRTPAGPGDARPCDARPGEARTGLPRPWRRL
ncbi:MAG: metalloregulator ArsR/SmtB family transcription factor [Holophagaceae bacterium]